MKLQRSPPNSVSHPKITESKMNKNTCKVKNKDSTSTWTRVLMLSNLPKPDSRQILTGILGQNKYHGHSKQYWPHSTLKRDSKGPCSISYSWFVRLRGSMWFPISFAADGSEMLFQNPNKPDMAWNLQSNPGASIA